MSTLRSRWWPYAAATVVSLVLPVSWLGTSVATADDDTAQQPDLENLQVGSEAVATGLIQPTDIAAPDDGSDRILVTEQPGLLRVYHPEEGLDEEPLLDLTDQILDTGLEQGLLGVAPHPDFANTPELYVTYTSEPDGDLVLARFPLSSPQETSIDPEDEEIVLTQEHSEFPNHNGGGIKFGPDGYLYWVLGDGGGGGDPMETGQDLTTLLGSMVRIDVTERCGEAEYCVPEDNPFVDEPEAEPEIWAYGLRNAWRFSFDPVDESLWIADVGQDLWEEVNHVTAQDTGANFGWACLEGYYLFDPEQCSPGMTYTDPVYVYGHEDGDCSVTGGYTYRGSEYADLAYGVHVITDHCTGNTRGLVPNEENKSYDGEPIGELPRLVTTFGTDQDNELYLAVLGPGELHRVTFS